MKELSNRVIAILIVIFILVTLLQVSVYFIRDKEITVRATAVGFVGMCVDNNPIIIPIVNQTATVNTLYTYDVDTTVTNDVNVTFGDDTDLFDINNNTGLISFMPQENDTGIHYINISAFSSCGFLNDVELMQLTIDVENTAPVLDPIPDFVINQSDNFTYDVNATDAENDTLSFGDNTTMFQINSVTGMIAFTPQQQDVGNQSVMIWVIDEHGLLDWDVSIFEIIDINDPPVLDTIGTQTAIINETYTYDVNVTDVDVKPEWSNISFYDNATFFDINQSTGLIQFFVNETFNGTYWINISVTDGELWDEEIVSFSVVAINHPPNITSWYPINDTLEINEGESQYFNITKFDLDGNIPSTQWYLDGSLLSGEIQDEYTYVASYTSSGVHNVTVIITDGELTDSHEWTLTVIDVPEAGGGGGGPSPGAAEPTCEEEWRCSEWSVCPIYETQTRDCWDVNECGTEFYKPGETRSCEYVPIPSCDDGVRNCHLGRCEIWIDCGGPCPPCPTCDDGVRNCHKTLAGTLVCEQERDCGGPCPPCPEIPLPAVCGDNICEQRELFTCLDDCGIFFIMFIILAIILGGVSVMLYRGSEFFMIFYRKKIRPPPYTDLELLGTTTLRKLHLIQLEIGKKRLPTVISEFSFVMRDFFAQRFDVRKKFTYIELAEVARKRKVGDSLAHKIAEFSMKMTEIEYRRIQPSVTDVNIAIKNAVIIVERLTNIKVREALDKRAEKELKRVEPKKEKAKLPEHPPEIKEKKYRMTENDKNSIKNLVALLESGERAFAEHKIEEAERIYAEIRKAYDSMHPEVKKSLYNETVRIIKLYNEIMKNIK